MIMSVCSISITVYALFWLISEEFDLQFGIVRGGEREGEGANQKEATCPVS